MTNKEYQDYVYNLINHPTSQINTDILHMILGVVTEAGELADCIKRGIGYNEWIDYENMEEEMGDVLFYVAGLAALLHLSLDDIMNLNKAKLDKRYPEGFSEKAAKERKDKSGT